MGITENRLNSTLYHKWKQNELGHFYILKAHPLERNKKERVHQWIKGFISRIINEERGHSENSALGMNILHEGHPDLYTLIPKEMEKNYKVDELAGFFPFHEHRPMEFRWRFMVIHHGHLLTPTILNKMLKTLEAPSEQTTIFLDNHKSGQLLPTIESRAIHLTIPLQNKELKEHSSSLNQGLDREYLLSQLNRSGELFNEEQQHLLKNTFQSQGHYHPLIDQLKRDHAFQSKLYQFLIELAPSLNSDTYKQKERLLNELKWFSHSKSFHSPPMERWVALLESIISS